MKYPLQSLFSALVLVVAVAAPAQGTPQEARGRLASDLDPFLDKLFALDLAPGMAIAVVQGEEVVYQRGFGYADADAKRPVTGETSFYIASSTKSFTGMAAAILHERGELDLDKPISGYIEAEFHAGVDADKITLRDLLTHTHGLSGDGPVSFRVAYSGQHDPKLLHELLQYHGPRERRFEYSNIGYNVASLVMDDVLGVGWKEVLRREIFDPLAMASTTAYASEVPGERRAMPYGEEPDGFQMLPYTKGDANMHAAGGMMTTVTDLAKWLEVNINEGRLDGQQVIPAEVVAEAHGPLVSQNATRGQFRRTGYGLGWNTGTYDGEEFWHHFGGFAGFHAHVSFMPEHDLGVASLVNTSRTGDLLADTASRYVYDRLRGREDTEERFEAELDAAREQVRQLRAGLAADRARRAERSQDLPHPLEAYTGTFESPIMGSVTFAVVDGELEMTMGRMWSAVEVYDGSQNALRVEPAGSGQVVFFDILDDEERARSLRFSGTEFTRIR